MASSVSEAVGCRYTQASDKLRRLLQLYTQQSRIASGRRDFSIGCASVTEQQLVPRIRAAYQDCLREQHHLNVVVSTVSRLQRILKLETSSSLPTDYSPMSAMTKLHHSPCDKLHNIQQLCVNSLVSLTLHPTAGTLPPSAMSEVLMTFCSSELASSLFCSVMVRGPVAAQVSFAIMLLRTCSGQQWWGDFLMDALHHLFRGDAQTLHRIPAIR